MGITTPLSTNPAMTIGGLTVGVTPLDMAHAYETIAHGGRRVSGTLAEDDAPVAIQEVDAGSHTLPDGAHHDVNHVRTTAVLPPEVAATETTMLETVLQYGTAKAAALGEFAAGKTGTTSNYGDAWFVGWNHKYTVAVWVGYPEQAGPDDDRLQRRTGARRYVPGADLARLHDLCAEHRKGPRRTRRASQRVLECRRPGNEQRRIRSPALDDGHIAEPLGPDHRRGCRHERGQGRRRLSHPRWRRRGVGPHPESGPRTGTHGLAGAVGARPGSSECSLLPGPIRAGGALLALLRRAGSVPGLG